mmetsp:Transcript_33684/g.43238  ORF Transcript_33684/g.43238 Transcript_33684/m.43238 type:complete len:190 (+) Transcript_33684:143-712(+)
MPFTFSVLNPRFCFSVNTSRQINSLKRALPFVVEQVFPKKFSSVESPESNMMTPSDQNRTRIKHKIPQKRASKLMNELTKEHCEALRKDFPDFRAGDAIEVTHYPYKTAPAPVTVKGTVISKVNRHLGSNFTVLNTVLGYPVEHQMNLYDPLLKEIKVLQKARIHDGKKRVRRSKLYYLRDRNPSQYSV